MKYAAVFLAILTGLALIFGIYVYAGARIQVTSVTLEVTPAFEKQGGVRHPADCHGSECPYGYAL